MATPSSRYRHVPAGRGVPWRLLGTGAQALEPAADRHLFARAASHAGATGIRRDVSIDGWFDLTFVQAELKQLGLEHCWPRYDASGKPQDKA